MKRKEITIFTDDFSQEVLDEFRRQMREDYEVEFSDDDLMLMWYDIIAHGYRETKELLDKELDGIVVAFARLQRWNGMRTGALAANSNLSSILDTHNCDEITAYADRYDVRCRLTHHDGTDNVIYRLAPSELVADRITQRAAAGTLTWDYFRRATKTLRPAVANVFGWEG